MPGMHWGISAMTHSAPLRKSFELGSAQQQQIVSARQKPLRRLDCAPLEQDLQKILESTQNRNGLTIPTLGDLASVRTCEGTQK